MFSKVCLTISPAPTARTPPKICLYPKNLPLRVEEIAFPHMSIKGIVATPPIKVNSASRKKEKEEKKKELESY